MYSNQPGENSTQQSDHPLVCVSKPLSVFIFVIYAAVFFLGVFGNFLVIFIVSRDSKLHTPFNYLVVNLAVSDTFVLLFSLPIVVFSECFSWPFDEFLCKLSRPSFLIFMGVSVCTMVALSFERYQAIVHPLALKMTRERAFFIIVFVWVLSCFAFGLPRFFVFGLTTEKGILQCDPIKQSFAIRTVTKIFRLIMTLILPCIVLSWAYSRVMRKLRNELAFIADAFASRDIERMRTTRNIKTMRLLVIIIVVFVVCFLPFNIVTLFGSLPNGITMKRSRICPGCFKCLTAASIPWSSVHWAQNFKRLWKNCVYVYSAKTCWKAKEKPTFYHKFGKVVLRRRRQTPIHLIPVCDCCGVLVSYT